MLHLSTRTKSLIKIKKEQSKISRKEKRERIISQKIIKNRKSPSGSGYRNEHKRNYKCTFRSDIS